VGVSGSVDPALMPTIKISAPSSSASLGATSVKQGSGSDKSVTRSNSDQQHKQIGSMYQDKG
jgi:hypothetical protein